MHQLVSVTTGSWISLVEDTNNNSHFKKVFYEPTFN